jgi:hypothetical protein
VVGRIAGTRNEVSKMEGMSTKQVVLLVTVEYPDGTAEPDDRDVGNRINGLAAGAMDVEGRWRIESVEFDTGTAWRVS